MAKVEVNRLLDLFERMYKEKWKYAWGAAKEGTVDCSGAFVYAYRVLGGPPIPHGSNSMYHMSVGALMPMAQARPGYAAFKVTPWTDNDKGNKWYGKEPGDVYHVGLVGRDGRILNAQGVATGFVSSVANSSWDGCAPLNDVDYSGYADSGETGGTTVSILYNAVVNTSSGPLRLRDRAVDGAVVASMPKGATVGVLEDGSEWWKVSYEGIEGYASSDYLAKVGGSEGQQPGGQEGVGDAAARTTLIRDDGTVIMMVGAWRVAED